MGVSAFITGIGGQDGSYLAELLVSQGVEVHALAHVEEGPPAFCPAEVTLHRGDLTDVAAIRQLVLDLAPQEIYNLAGLSSVALSWEKPDLTTSVNAVGAAGLMETALQLKLRHNIDVRFVQAASAEIFGNPLTAPQTEQTPIAPVSPYGASKAFAHLLAGVYRGRGLHCSSLVLYNHESPRRPLQFVTRKITHTVAAIARGDADTLTLGNMAARRDWGWAPDYVEAMVLAARTSRPDDFVIATGESHSIADFVEAAFAAVGISEWQDRVQTDQALMRPQDASELRGDASKAHRVLGWQPKVRFAQLVEAMVRAESENQ